MKPALPPGLVSLLCKTSQRAVPDRSLRRLLSRPWGKWKVEVAEKWCAACGFDFWNLDAAHHLDKIKAVDWTRRTKRLRRALGEVLRAAGFKNPTLRQQDALAEAFQKLASGK